MVGQHDVHAAPRQGGAKAAAAVAGMEGSSGATQKPALTAPRKASANSMGSSTTRPMVVRPRARTPPEQGAPPLHALLELAEGQRSSGPSVLDVGPVAQQHRAGADEVAQSDVGSGAAAAAATRRSSTAASSW